MLLRQPLQSLHSAAALIYIAYSMKEFYATHLTAMSHASKAHRLQLLQKFDI